MNALLLDPSLLGSGNPVLAGAWNDIMVYALRTLFFLSAILLMIIILLQEGKGGGLAAALGGQGADTFGVSTGGVNKVTLTLAGLFLLSGVFHAIVSADRSAIGSLKRNAVQQGDGDGGGGSLDTRDLEDGAGGGLHEGHDHEDGSGGTGDGGAPGKDGSAGDAPEKPAGDTPGDGKPVDEKPAETPPAEDQ